MCQHVRCPCKKEGKYCNARCRCKSRAGPCKNRAVVAAIEAVDNGTGSSRVQAELEANRERVKVSCEFCHTSAQSNFYFIGTSAFSNQRAAGGPASQVAR